MFICCPKSSLTSLLAQDKIESKSLTFWIQIRTAQTYLTQNAHKFFIRTPNWVILFLLETRFRALSNPIGITFKFVRRVELWTKQSDAAAESESNYKSKMLHHLHLGPLALYDLDLVLGCLGTSSHLLGRHPLLLYKQIHLVAFPRGFVQLKVSHCNFVYFVCVQRPDQDRLRIPTFINTSYIFGIFKLLYHILARSSVACRNRPSWSG